MISTSNAFEGNQRATSIAADRSQIESVERPLRSPARSLVPRYAPGSRPLVEATQSGMPSSTRSIRLTPVADCLWQ